MGVTGMQDPLLCPIGDRSQVGEARRRVVDEGTLFLLLGEIWFRVEIGVLPKEPQYDVVLRKSVSRSVQADLRQCQYLYGSSDFYAVSKRQISTREIKAHQLR